MSERHRPISLLFVIAGAYDAVLGLAVLLGGPALLASLGAHPPAHPGYLQFPALLLLVFAAMFFRIAADPRRFRENILYGAGLKVAYTGTVFGHALATGVPPLWLVWAYADLVFLLFFFLAWKTLRS